MKGIGVYEHVRSHTRGGDKYVTVIIDQTRSLVVRSGVLDMVPSRSKAVLTTWLDEWPQPWWDGIEVVAMGRIT